MVTIQMRADRLPHRDRAAYIERESKKIAHKMPIHIVPMLPHGDVQWRRCERVDLPEPSAAETLIINELNRYRVDWHREVEFLQHRKSEYGYYRYDFYLPTLNLVIEYDGALHHSNPEQVANDKEKSRFCKEHNISMVRYNKTHYYNMHKEIATLMKKYGVLLK